MVMVSPPDMIMTQRMLETIQVIKGARARLAATAGE
jgi:hypothetical protein